MKLQLLALSISIISLTSIIAAPILAIATAINSNSINHSSKELFTATKPTLLAQQDVRDATRRGIDTNTNTSQLAHKITVKILGAKALSQFDSSITGPLPIGGVSPFTGGGPEADFSVKIKINGRSLPPLEGFKNSDDPIFIPDTRSLSLPVNVESVPIEITLVDDDAFGRENVADISSVVRERTLKLRYILSTGKIIGPTGTEIGRSGRAITSTGESDVHKARLTFSITHSLL